MSKLKKRTISYKSETCIYCNENLSTRKGDHVPPKSWISGRIRKNYPVVRVPCCEECNESFKRDDDKFRLFITATYQAGESHHGRQMWKKALSGIGHEKAEGLRKSFFSHIEQEVELFSPSGEYLGQSARIKYDDELTSRVFDRIVRALFYERFKNRLIDDCVIKTGCHLFLDVNRMSEIIETLDPVLSQENNPLCPGVFEYKVCAARQDTEATIWAFLLYDSIIFFSFTWVDN